MELLPPAVNQAGIEVGPPYNLLHHRTRGERGSHNRPLLLLAPPAATLDAADYLNLGHGTIFSLNFPLFERSSP